MKKLMAMAVLCALPAAGFAGDAPEFGEIRKADFAAAGAAVPAAGAPGWEKIVGGVEAAKGEFPFIVSLQNGSYGHFCGGSLIKKNWVLTAAHCVPAGIQTAVAGLHGQGDSQGVERLEVERVISHPDYNKQPQDYDFALLKLKSDSSYPTVELNRRELSGKVSLVTAGWGATSEGGGAADLLQKVTVPLVSASRCEKAYPGKITGRMLCAGFDAGKKDSCQGDSGGPLLAGSGANRVLAGVVSWGEGCARPKKYGVYSKVSSVLEWIEKETK